MLPAEFPISRAMTPPAFRAPAIAIDKPAYEPGERIEAKFETSQEMVGRGWIGLVPANRAHAAEEGVLTPGVRMFVMLVREGVATFTVPGTPGRWAIRMYDGSGRGTERASVTFEVRSA
jgi:hypothetical protein